MMNVWSAVRWWDEWQLRILVLGSLGVQWFLLVAAPIRKYTIPRCFRTFIWLAYISSDALAIYALATLFNRHARASSSSCTCSGGGAGSNILEVLWAPVLLIHLGGQEYMTGYAIEDNELWTRQTVTLVSQVTVAVYAFYKSWPTSSDTRLVASAILLFVIGILSFSEKPWAFKRASINRLAAMSSLRQGGRSPPSVWESCFTEMDLDLQERKINMCGRWLRDKRPGFEGSKKPRILSERDKVHMILSDMSLLAADSDLKKKWGEAHGKVQVQREVLDILDPLAESSTEVLDNLDSSAERSTIPWLRRAFGLIYTRANVVSTPAYLAYHLLVVPSLHITAIVLFATSRKHGFNRTDVKTTYVLLCFTAALDVLGVFIIELLYWLMHRAGVPKLCETVPQYSNVINSALRRTQPTGVLLKCAARVGYKEGYFGRYKSRDLNLYAKVAGFIFTNLVGMKDIDLTSYRSFRKGENSNWVLTEELRKKCSKRIRDSLRGSFDRSVLVWHMATDLCFRHRYPGGPDDEEGMPLREVCTQAISNYMAHLLTFRSDMLMTGSRQSLFTQAMDEVEAILKLPRTRPGQPPHNPQRLDLALTIEDIVGVHLPLKRKREADALPDYPLLHEACVLAKELIALDDLGRDEAEGQECRLELMYRVWLGMLCYSASMCRGYLHAKSLGEGGEFLSSVWLALSLKGARTLADKLQMPEPDGEDIISPVQGSKPDGPVEHAQQQVEPPGPGEDFSFLFSGLQENTRPTRPPPPGDVRSLFR